MIGNWIVEFAELSGMASREREKITSFLSRQVDKARPAYGRRSETVPRQFIAFGTTNDREYLPRDERRILPVEIGLFDLKALARDVEQLWAEAAYYEARGESIVLDEALWGEAEEVRGERLFENPYRSILAAGLGADIVVLSRKVWALLDIPPERQQREGRRVGQAMISLGFVRHRARRDKEVEGVARDDYFYIRGQE